MYIEYQQISKYISYIITEHKNKRNHVFSRIYFSASLGGGSQRQQRGPRPSTTGHHHVHPQSSHRRGQPCGRGAVVDSGGKQLVKSGGKHHQVGEIWQTCGTIWKNVAKLVGGLAFCFGESIAPIFYFLLLILKRRTNMFRPVETTNRF